MSNGSKIYEGRVGVYVNGSWGTICDDTVYSGNGIAEVLCRNLGLPRYDQFSYLVHAFEFEI
jgi:hypothetical protein